MQVITTLLAQNSAAVSCRGRVAYTFAAFIAKADAPVQGSS